MSLSLRLLIAFGCMAVLSTAMVGLLARFEWRRTENDRFDRQVQGASAGIALEIRAEEEAVHDLLRPLCKHDAFVDRTLVDVQARRLDGGRRLAIAQLVPEEMKALRLDELTLLVDTGERLSHACSVRLALVGAQDADVRPDEMAQHVTIDEAAGLRLLVAKSRGDRAGAWWGNRLRSGPPGRSIRRDHSMRRPTLARPTFRCRTC